MHDKKVSEKVIWEGSITPDDEVATFNNNMPNSSQMQTQPQMMFCYKCNNVIPSNSEYCPCCATKLFVECPKCKAKYSSQYPVCNQCGTNREEMRQREILERQWREQKRKEEQKREEERKTKEYYYKLENEQIKDTEEYKLAYTLFGKAFKRAQVLGSTIVCIPVVMFVLWTLFSVELINNAVIPERIFFGVLGIIALVMIIVFIVVAICLNNIEFSIWDLKYHPTITKYVNKNNPDKEMITDEVIKMVYSQGNDRLSECCVIAYRKKNKMPIDYRLHKLKPGGPRL